MSPHSMERCDPRKLIKSDLHESAYLLLLLFFFICQFVIEKVMSIHFHIRKLREEIFNLNK